MNPIISVILPVYNSQDYLKECIKSLLNQTFNNFELIIINDGSTDNSENIILSFKDNRIRYHSNNTNLGIIKSLNKAIDLAKGEFISRMDSDDIAVSTLFEKQLRIFDQYKEISLLNIRTYCLLGDTNFYKRNNHIISPNFESIRHINFIQNLISHPGIMIKAKILKEYKYNDIQDIIHFEDVELWQRILNDGHICYTIHENLLFYRIHNKSINYVYSADRRKRRIQYTKKILNTSYNTNFEDVSLSVLYGNYEKSSYENIKLLENDLNNYIMKVDKSFIISEEGYKDLVCWKFLILFFTIINSINVVKIKYKIPLIYLLMKRLPKWLNNMKFRLKIIEIITNTKKSYYPI